MSQNNSLPKETMTKISQLLLNGDRTEDVAKAVNLTLGKVGYIRTKMVAAGILDRKRASRKRSKINSATPVTAVKKAERTTDATPNLYPILGSNTFVFRINDMEVQISEAKQVHVKKGGVEIKF